MKNNILTLNKNMNQIIESIQVQGFHKSPEILQEYNKTNINNNDWLQYVTINPHHYHRSKVYADDIFEIFVITWNMKQQSKIHDHSDNGCYMLMLQGKLVEEIYDSNDIVSPTKISCFEEGFVGYIDNTMGYHRIQNLSDTDIAVSLHVYSPPNHNAKLLG